LWENPDVLGWSCWSGQGKLDVLLLVCRFKMTSYPNMLNITASCLQIHKNHN
jgi:hypothetical protein